LGGWQAFLDSANTALDETRRMLREVKSPIYPNALASMNPLIIGPSVCPISIVVARKPIEAPTSLGGASSLVKGDVDEITIANPNP
jgi:hypothetical protein